MSAIRAASAALLLSAAACGGGDSASSESRGGASDTARVASRPAPPADRPTVRIRTSEYRIEITPVDVPAGPVTFDVENAGSEAHGLKIEGQGVEAETGGVQPGGEAAVTATLPPGTYEVYCPMESGGERHRDRGMRTTITVR